MKNLEINQKIKVEVKEDRIIVMTDILDQEIDINTREIRSIEIKEVWEIETMMIIITNMIIIKTNIDDHVQDQEGQLDQYQKDLDDQEVIQDIPKIGTEEGIKVEVLIIKDIKEDIPKWF